jgi:hypothetical protein
MKALRCVALLTLLALTSCGIPATGVVEAGGPASGTLPMTRVYFVANGALVAMPRTTEMPGDPEAALQLLTAGPLAGEEGRTGRLSTDVPGIPTAMAPPPATDGPGKAASPDTFTVTVKSDAMTIRLPLGMDRLSGTGVRQIVCTAAAAYRDGGGWQATASDENCPER